MGRCHSFFLCVVPALITDAAGWLAVAVAYYVGSFGFCSKVYATSTASGTGLRPSMQTATVRSCHHHIIITSSSYHRHHRIIITLPRHCHVPSHVPSACLMPFCVAMPLCSCLTFCMTLLACSRAVCPASPAFPALRCGHPFRAAIAARVCERLRRAGDTPAARAGGACVSGDGC